MLSVCAILRAYALNDAEGFEALVKGGPAESYGDLLAFALMILQYHHGDPVAYLNEMANSLVVLAQQEAARAN